MAMGSPGRSRRKPNTTTDTAATMRTVWASRPKRMGSDPTILSDLSDPGALEEEHRERIELEPLDPVTHEHVELELRERDHGDVLVDERQRLRVRLGALGGVELLAALVEQGVHLGVGVA